MPLTAMESVDLFPGTVHMVTDTKSVTSTESKSLCAGQDFVVIKVLQGRNLTPRAPYMP